MKVLLKETVEKLGERGAIVDVAVGYARNYLLARGLAVVATSANFHEVELEKAKLVKRAAKERAELEAARVRLEEASCTIVAAASPEGHLYGSVGPKEVSEALAKEGFKVDEHSITLEQPFKEVGVYTVDVKLAADVAAQTRIWIVSE